MGRSGLYVPLDVNFSDDDKVLCCSAEAQLVYLRSLLLAKRFQKDGLVYRSQLRRLTEGFAYADAALDDLLPKELVDCGLWLDHEDGWVVAAFTAHNPTSAELEESRAKEADRKRVARGQKGTKAASENVQPDKNRVRASESNSESDLQSESESLAPTKSSTPSVRTRDVIFEALAEACGIDWNRISGSERGALNKAAAELRPLEATPAEIHQRAKNYRSHFEAAALTPSALARHWGKCEHPPRTNHAGKGQAVIDRLRSRTDVIDTNGRAIG